MPVNILHNPRCSKSRQSLELLNKHGVDIKVIQYLKNPPTPSEIKSIAFVAFGKDFNAQLDIIEAELF